MSSSKNLISNYITNKSNVVFLCVCVCAAISRHFSGEGHSCQTFMK